MSLDKHNDISIPITMEMDASPSIKLATDKVTTTTTPIIRIETRWAPKDFKELQASSDKFFERSIQSSFASKMKKPAL
jgi:hypothetical protein